MIIVSDFQFKNGNEELIPRFSEAFPYVCIHRNMDRYIVRKIPWHAHTAFEIAYITEGEIEYRTSSDSFTAKKGEIVFINSNVLHEVSAKAKGSSLYANLFDIHFVSGWEHSIFEKKYLYPIRRSKNIPAFIIKPDTMNNCHMVNEIIKTIELCEKEEEGFEFAIRETLSKFMFLLYQTLKGMIGDEEEPEDIDDKRIKAMMQFIQHNYSEKLTVGKIAGYANISKRECNRCFQRKLRSTPMNYLNDQRIRMAARRLIQTTDTITQIASDCGFSSGSYFSKAFHDSLGFTPREYRKNNGR